MAWHGMARYDFDCPYVWDPSVILPPHLVEAQERYADDMDRLLYPQPVRPKERLNNVMSRGIYTALKDNKSGCHWESFVDYTLAELVGHLESLFQAGMNWDNYGKWHVDHIRPRASFSFECADDPEFQECWALKNLQPLWAADNMRKGATYKTDNDSDPANPF